MDDTKTIKINLQRGDLHFSFDNYSYIFDKTIFARQWNHICAVFKVTNLTIFYNGNKTETTKVKIDPNVFARHTMLIVGTEGYIEKPYTGKLGDIRIFQRNLTSKEAISVFKVKKEPSLFISIHPPNTTDDYYYYYDDDAYSGSGSGSGYGDNNGSSNSTNNSTDYSGYSGYSGDHNSLDDYDYNYNYNYNYDLNGSSYYSYSGIMTNYAYDEEYDTLLDVIGLFYKNSEVQFVAVNSDTLKIEKELLNFFLLKEKTTFSKAKTICHRFGSTVAKVSVVSKIVIWAEKYNNSVPYVWLAKYDSKTKKESCFMGLKTQRREIKTVPADCASSYHVFCMSRFRPTIRAYGIPDEDKPINLTIIYEHDKLSIDSYERFYFVFNDSKLILNDFDNVKSIPLQMPYKKTQDVLGRHLWSNDYDLWDILINLSACRHGQFTCDNGQCISLFNVCDLENNCEDGSDERTCEATVKVSEHYNKKYSETQGTKNSTNVTGNLILNQINKVNMDDGKVDIGVTFVTHWADKRLAFKFLPPGIERDIPADEFENYWLPHIVVEGADHSDMHKLSVHKSKGKLNVYTFQKGLFEISETYEVLKTPGKHVAMNHNKTDNMNLLCKMELFYFPFDIQICKVRVVLKGHLRDDAEWNIYTSAFKSDDLAVSLFEVDNVTLHVHDDDKTKSSLILVLRRKYGAYIFNTFLPCIILQVIGLLTPALPIDDLSDRLAVTLSCLIVMAALFTQVSTTLPASAEPKLIDIWMCAHVAILFLVFLVHIFMSLAMDSESEKEKANASDDVKIIDNKKWAVMKSMLELDQIEIKNPPNEDKKKDSFISRWWTGTSVNRIGFIICNLTYTLFCIVFVLIINFPPE